MSKGKPLTAFALPKGVNPSAFIRQEGSAEPAKADTSPRKVAYTVKIPESLHQSLKLKLVKERTSVQALALDAVMAFLGPDAEGLK